MQTCFPCLVDNTMERERRDNTKRRRIETLKLLPEQWFFSTIGKSNRCCLWLFSSVGRAEA